MTQVTQSQLIKNLYNSRRLIKDKIGKMGCCLSCIECGKCYEPCFSCACSKCGFYHRDGTRPCGYLTGNKNNVYEERIRQKHNWRVYEYGWNNE